MLRLDGTLNSVMKLRVVHYLYVRMYLNDACINLAAVFTQFKCVCVPLGSITLVSAISNSCFKLK